MTEAVTARVTPQEIDRLVRHQAELRGLLDSLAQRLETTREATLLDLPACRERAAHSRRLCARRGRRPKIPHYRLLIVPSYYGNMEPLR